MLAGKLLATAGMAKYPQVSYYPHFDSLMRGGQSECQVVLSTGEISSPLSSQIQAGILMHPQFLEQYKKRVISGGLLIVDSSVVHKRVGRKDIQVLRLPATQMAAELGDRRVANLLLLGAYLEATGSLPLETVEEALSKLLEGRGDKVFSLNQRALREGAEFVAQRVMKKRRGKSSD